MWSQVCECDDEIADVITRSLRSLVITQMSQTEAIIPYYTLVMIIKISIYTRDEFFSLIIGCLRLYTWSVPNILEIGRCWLMFWNGKVGSNLDTLHCSSPNEEIRSFSSGSLRSCRSHCSLCLCYATFRNQRSWPVRQQPWKIQFKKLIKTSSKSAKIAS